jgi:hypothetical protein
MSKFRGFFYDRVEFNDREKAFADQWEDENMVAGGQMADTLRERSLIRLLLSNKKLEYFGRDEQIVASIIQWLGSNVGWCFLNDALKRCGYKIVKESSHE